MKIFIKHGDVVFKPENIEGFSKILSNEIKAKLIYYFGNDIGVNDSYISFSRQQFYNYRDRLQAIDSGYISIKEGKTLYKLSYKINLSSVYIGIFAIFLIATIPTLIANFVPFYIVLATTTPILFAAPILAGISEVSFHTIIVNCIRRSGGIIFKGNA